jgi:hypothetical protein
MVASGKARGQIRAHTFLCGRKILQDSLISVLSPFSLSQPHFRVETVVNAAAEDSDFQRGQEIAAWVPEILALPAATDFRPSTGGILAAEE